MLAGMDPVRSSLRFVVGTALLTTAGVGAACTGKPAVNTVANDGKAGSGARPEAQDPIVDALPAEKPDEPPAIGNTVPSPPTEEPPIVNTVVSPPEPKTPRPPTVNTVPTPPPREPPRVNLSPIRPPPPEEPPKKIVNTRPDVEKLDE